ncbi:MAG: 2-C-methyl-D-erythritol 2,4-cyclodiphosphate synthase [Gemmatimonadaceae bacterium]|nr:2-C-methyl-D-erythritol 2,4-cyclodiphosphate synthase [Gemmatimonadaceae bacterium]
MGVRFGSGARKAIDAAMVEAERHGLDLPNSLHLLLGMLRAPRGTASQMMAMLGMPVDLIIRAVESRLSGAGAVAMAESEDAAEAILRAAGEEAERRGGGVVSEGDIMRAIGHSPFSGAGRVLLEAGITAERLDQLPVELVSDTPAAASARPAMRIRTGIGYDSHRFGPGDGVVLGGVLIPGSQRLVGHSDGDAVAHAVTDAILGGAGVGDIGEMFSDLDAANKGRDSIEMLHLAVERARLAGWTPAQVDVTVIAESPRVGPYRGSMRERLAHALGISVAEVMVKGKSNEGMGWIGRGEGVAVIAVATLCTFEMERR